MKLQVLKIVIGSTVFWLAYVPLWCIHEASGKGLEGIDTAMTMLGEWCRKVR